MPAVLCRNIHHSDHTHAYAGNMLQARMERIEAEKHTRDRAAALQKVEDAFVFCQSLAGGAAEDASTISVEQEAQTSDDADPERRGDDAVHVSASPGAWKGRFQNPITKAWLEMELPVVARDDRELWSAQGCDIGAFTLTASAKHGEVILVKSYDGKQGNKRQGATYQGTLLNGKLVGTFMLAKDEGATSGLFELEVGEESVLTQICREHDADEHDSFLRECASKASFCSHHALGQVLDGNHGAEAVARDVQLEIRKNAQAGERREKLETQALTQRNVVNEHTDVEDEDPEDDDGNEDKHEHEHEHEHEDEKDKGDRGTRIGASATLNPSSPPSLKIPLDLPQAHHAKPVAAHENSELVSGGKFSSLLLKGAEDAEHLQGEREEEDNRDTPGMPQTGFACKDESSDMAHAGHYTADTVREESVGMSCDYEQVLRAQTSPKTGSPRMCTAAEMMHSGHETEDTVRHTPLSSDTHHTLFSLEDTRFHAYNSAGLSSRLSSVSNSSSPISSARPPRYSQASPPRVASPPIGSERCAESYNKSRREARFRYSKSPPPSSDSSLPSASKELMSQWAFEKAVEFLKAQTSMPSSDDNNSLSGKSENNGCKIDPPYLREWKVQRGIDSLSQPELRHGIDFKCRFLDDSAAAAATQRSACLGEDESPMTGEQISSKRTSTQELLARMQAHYQKTEPSTHRDTKDRVTHIVMEGTGVGGVSGAIEQRNTALAKEEKSLSCNHNDASCFLGASVEEGQKSRQNTASVADASRNDEGKDVQEQMSEREHGEKQSGQQETVGPMNGTKGQEKLRAWESTGRVEDGCQHKNPDGKEHATREEDQARTGEEIQQNFTGVLESEKAKEDGGEEEGTDESEEERQVNAAIEAQEKEKLRTGAAEVVQRKDVATRKVKESSEDEDAKEAEQSTRDGSGEETDEDDEETIELADVKGILYHQEIEFQRDLYRDRSLYKSPILCRCTLPCVCVNGARLRLTSGSLCQAQEDALQSPATA